ncbi:MAG: thiopurine S-methyltransferase [Spirochaetia bacterium]|nr:thiopurine S-methyltransferase [Spirochaetia bacterium]
MDASFWLRKWAENDIAFHESQANPNLVKYFGDLGVRKGGRVFVPLCGKTLDIAWLLARGYRVAGAELSEVAIRQLFAGLGMEPRVTEVGKLKHFQGTGIDIFVGDIFDLSSDVLGPVDAIYDRAALVALPGEMRQRYTAHTIDLTRNAPQLLICYTYEESSMKGPPFSISDQEVEQHYSKQFELRLVDTGPVSGGLKGNFEVTENVWLLKSKRA